MGIGGDWMYAGKYVVDRHDKQYNMAWTVRRPLWYELAQKKSVCKRQSKYICR